MSKLSLNKMAETAEALNIPLWMLMIPGLAERKELLKPDALKPLQALVENYINGAAVPVPQNPMCLANHPDETLNSAHAMMELICALDRNFGTSEFEMPDSIAVTLDHMRVLVRDSIKFAEEAFGPWVDRYEKRVLELERARTAS
jgi:hypothetical protein